MSFSTGFAQAARAAAAEAGEEGMMEDEGQAATSSLFGSKSGNIGFMR